ncbi:FG-GAP repeat protein, partial [Crocosphaera sp.]|uniref:FG-GAP repeat protein n=1 Tax=Crocosphaera sp. TaxID=2729996 RepID=UPI00257B705B
MFGLEKLIYLHKGKYSLYFNSLTTSVLGLSFGLGLVCTNSASAFEFDKKLVAPDGAANDFFGTPRSVSLSGNTALPEFLTKSAIAKHRSLTGSGFEQSD